MLKTFLVLICLALLLFGGGYLFLKSIVRDIAIEPGSGYDPKLVFEKTLCRPIPSSVQNLQGDAFTWQGYSAYLRFNASDSDINLLLKQGFEKIPMSNVDSLISLYFQHPNISKIFFSPPWNPEIIKVKECYGMDNISNDWTNSASKWLIIDRSKNEIYFVGFGT